MTDKNKDALEALERLVEKIPFDPDCEKVPRAVGFEAAFKDFMTVKAALTAQVSVTKGKKK